MKRENETGLLEMRDAIPDAGEVIYLSLEDQRRVAEAILNPPEPAEAMVRAFERYLHHYAHEAMWQMEDYH